MNAGGGYRRLMAAVIALAMTDLENRQMSHTLRVRPRQRDDAMAFMLSECCDSWCYELNTDYAALRDRAAMLYERGNET